MGASVRKYRDEVYKLRSHPEAKPYYFGPDERDSFFRVYLSILPFLMLEYIVEARFDSPIAGIMFPTGFLLFWAFYYTYYRPGLLEAKLSTAADGALSDFPKIIFGTAIWFVKATVFGVIKFATDFFWEQTPRKATLKQVPPVRMAYTRAQRPQADRTAHEPLHEKTQTNFRPRPAATPPPLKKEQAPPPLPSELISALKVLGLADCRDWRIIHHRYRELAKKYHPDHNPSEITAAGKQFQVCDAAYRKLLQSKARYFPEAK